MLKRDYVKIKSLYESLKEAHQEIIQLLQNLQLDQVLQLLKTCQEVALFIGQKLEKEIGEGTKLVHELELYCEKIFELYNYIQTEFVINNDKIAPILLKLQEYQNNSSEIFLKEISYLKEIVFLPYKASMWDSLETVWKKSKNDPNLNAVVIPIPYFEKKSDGTLGEMRYEGSEYPDYVDITDYNEYDFENIHPDEIYIHNPYDNCNIITTVHPAFYSKNLKTYTDKLIYIPYFVLAEVVPESGANLENIEKFCLVPGVFNADKVILQSEQMRQAYINILSYTFGEETRKMWEGRMEGTGSPKFEKLKNTKLEELNIPDSWTALMFDSNGKRKKVILYNNSVAALLRNRESMLIKMKNVLEFFKDREDVTLLWRPHPLIKATIESTEPQLYSEYIEIEEKYIEEGWGIYDDTSELHRAILLCDAYYGDHSSLVQLCQSVNKPVMIQNVYTLY